MTKKVAAISNTCASVIGGGLLFLAGELESEQLKLAATTTIPAFTLFLAYAFKLAGSFGSLSIFKFFFKRKAMSRIESLKKAINDPNISEEKRKCYQDNYAQTLDYLMEIDNEDMKALKTMTDEARSKFTSDINSGYKNNTEVTESLDKAGEKPTEQ
ncbi:hypothetical protein FQP85_03145 [Pseudoalteromonas neustonica]|uniref:Uncharacterized protein n=1 Tax=Pseudoalteromonas neustonica TaxID=1840331 RepID=A0ABY3FIJ4_9GAMM|nr:hypothetical protein [Pseudoalteromonas neustonica]TVU86086.1 hypothetical protein FQP85_03145 [Pseudoalteromonas neustonica]